ncbi:hypothetical protein WA026_023862 [Henosepilachna vigintioctopunctata]|uniref:Uncharacterized protein n=1 Tax=Henosepilachna vigintioctopunctata TaxID=420089 RepID=A0AAW1TQA7_9CUCU
MDEFYELYYLQGEFKKTQHNEDWRSIGTALDQAVRHPINIDHTSIVFPNCIWTRYCYLVACNLNFNTAQSQEHRRPYMKNFLIFSRQMK